MAKKWIQSAIRKPGALHRQLGIPEGQSIPESTLRSAAAKGGKLGERARLALTLKGMHHKKAPKARMSSEEAASKLYGGKK